MAHDMSTCSAIFKPIIYTQGRGVFFNAADGSSYDGQWENGKRDGDGLLTLADGCTIEGRWVEGHISGPVKFTFCKGHFWANPEH